MSAPAFYAQNGAVFWGAVPLSPQSVDAVLDVFEREGAAAAFNELYSASLAAGGIPRGTSLRLVTVAA